MASPTSLELSVGGVLNGQQFSAHGTLAIDLATGTKVGNVLFAGLPASFGAGPHSIILITGKGHLGGVLKPGQKIGPSQLLGAQFESFRLSTVGKRGTLSVSEQTVIQGSKARSRMITVGELRLPRLEGMGPLREIIRVSGDDTLVGEGRYSLVPVRGRSIPVRYTHFYRSFQPNRRLFRGLRRAVYELRVVFACKSRGQTLYYRSRSTLRRI